MHIYHYMHPVKKLANLAAQYLLRIFCIPFDRDHQPRKIPQKRKDPKLHRLQAGRLLSDRWCMINQALRDEKLLEPLLGCYHLLRDEVS